MLGQHRSESMFTDAEGSIVLFAMATTPCFLAMVRSSSSR
jgi:hypothetical protein